MIRTWFAVACLLAAATAGAAPADALRFRRDLALPNEAVAELFAVPFDAAIDAATADGYPDVRILDAAGREMSFLVRPAVRVRSWVQRDRWPTGDPELRPQPDGSLWIEFSIDAERHPEMVDGLTIATPLRDFEQRVRVARLGDDGQWDDLVTEALLFDFSRFADARQVDVAFPANVERRAGGRYRLVLEAATQEQRSQLAEFVRTFNASGETSRSERRLTLDQPFRIDRIEAWHERSMSTPDALEVVERPLDRVTTTVDERDRTTRIRVEAGRMPLSGLRFRVRDPNFRRDVVVHRIVSPASAPAVVGFGTIERVDLRDIRREQLDVAFPEARLGAFEIVVTNDDSPPLTIDDVLGLGSRREAVFLAAPDSRPILAYGGTGIPAPRYDTAAVEAALAAGQQPLAAAAGPVREVDVRPMEQPFVRALLNNPWFLGGGIVALALLLALTLARAVRSIPPPT